MGKIRFSRREFLNKPGFYSVANIMIEFENARDDKGVYYPHYGGMYISNCERTSHFELDVDTVEGVGNSLHKLSKIIEVCEDARKELIKMQVEIKKRAKDKEGESKAKGIVVKYDQKGDADASSSLPVMLDR